VWPADAPALQSYFSWASSLRGIGVGGKGAGLPPGRPSITNSPCTGHEVPLKPRKNASASPAWQTERRWVRLHTAFLCTGLPKGSAGNGKDYRPQIEGVIEPKRRAEANFLIFRAAYPIGLEVTEHSHR
jgi:hypothetical protein